jgi:hypothetical protein
MENRGVSAGSGREMSEFERNITAADEYDAGRQLVQFQKLFTRDRMLCARDFQIHRPGFRRDHQIRAFEKIVAHLNGRGTDESRTAMKCGDFPFFRKPSWLDCGTRSIIERLNRINSGQSIRACSARIPFPRIRRFQSITSPAPTRILFGSQPRRAHVPPNGLESTTATSRPASRQRYATVDAADPVPITTTSTFLIMNVSARVRPR